MHFDLSDEQKQLEAGVERLLTDAVDLQALTKGPDSVAQVSASLAVRLAELGVGAVLVDEADGGLGMGLLTLAVLSDCFGRHAAPTNALEGALAAWLVSQSGDAELRGRWLEPLMSG